MSRILFPSLCVLALLVSCSNPKAPEPVGPEPASSDAAIAAAADREFQFTYTARIPAPAPGTKVLDIWVPLPLEDPGVQEIRDLKTWVNGDETKGARRNDDVFGNPMFHVRMENPTTETQVRWTAKIWRFTDSGQGQGRNIDRYLQPNRLIALDGPAKDLAVSLGVDDPSVPTAERAKRVYDDVLNGMEYNKSVPGYGFGDFDRSVTVCKGNCTDFHARFIGTSRAGKIPTRFTMGIPLKPQFEGTYNSYHCWAHWYDGSRWHPVDISEADKVAATDPAKAEWFFGHLDPHRVSMSYGRDIILSPAQKGPALNYFVFPYAEADGVEVPLSKDKNWDFHYKGA